MRALVFRALEFDRSSIPAELKDLETWPTVDPSAIEPTRRAIFLARVEALRLYVEAVDMPLTEIDARTGVNRNSLTRMFTRCVEGHPDGRIHGFRALVPFKHLRPYQRTAPVQFGTAASNASGAFSQLLACYPSLASWLARAARDRRRRAEGRREVRPKLPSLHKTFLERCRALGITSERYPFNQQRMAVRSLATHLKRLTEDASFEAAAADAGATHVGRAWSTTLEHLTKPVRRPFEVVEFDGHKIDVRLRVRVIDPFGIEAVYEIGRIWILLLLDVATRAALGYALALGPEYSKDEVVEAIQAGLTPHRRRELTIAGLTYRADGGIPSEVIPEVAYACWDCFRLDNAKAHLADHTLTQLTEVVGCWPDLGPPGEPNERAFVERFFLLLSNHLSHRLPGTTGSHPQDMHRVLGDPGGDTSLLICLDELEQLIDVMICDYNAEARDGLGGRTPLEAMRYFLSTQTEPVRTLARTRRDAVLLQESRVVTVKGSRERGVRPHINFIGARYSSDVLSGNAGLIGRRLRIYFDSKDLRRVRAYFENGDELGFLMAARPWCFTAHSLRVRKEILRLRARGKLRYREGDDAVQAYTKVKHKDARRSRRAASELAKLAAVRAATQARSHEMAPDSVDSVPIAHAPAPPSPAEVRTDESRQALFKTVEPRVKPLRLRKAIIF